MPTKTDFCIEKKEQELAESYDSNTLNSTLDFYRKKIPGRQTVTKTGSASVPLPNT